MDTRLGPDGTQSPRLPVKKGTINRVNGPVRRSTDDLALFLRVWIVIGQCRQNKTRLSAGFHSKNCGVARPWCNRATCVRRLTPDPNEIFSVESPGSTLDDRTLRPFADEPILWGESPRSVRCNRLDLWCATMVGPIRPFDEAPQSYRRFRPVRRSGQTVRPPEGQNPRRDRIARWLQKRSCIDS